MTKNFQSMSKKYRHLQKDTEPPKPPSSFIQRPPEITPPKPKKHVPVTPSTLDQERTIIIKASPPIASKSHTPLQAPTSQIKLGASTFGSRVVCVNCGASGKKIKLKEDKTQIISYIPQVMYKKRYFCSQCGYRFD